MALLTYQINKLYLEDLGFGVGTTTQVRGNTTVSLTEINAANIPFDESSTLQEVLNTSYPNVTIVADNISSVNAVGTNMAYITTVATDVASVIVAATNVNDIVTAATNILAISATATNILDIIEVAGISSDVTIVAANESNIATVVANITDIQNAVDNAATAVTKASEASTSADLAERYATEEEDVEVLPGKYSAKHYAAKAQDIVTGNIDALTDVDTTGKVGGSIFSYDSVAGKWVANGNINSIVYNTYGVEANKQAIAALSSASGTFSSTIAGYPISLTTSSVQMPFKIDSQSSDSEVFIFNNDNTVTFLEDIRYTFLSTVVFHCINPSGATENITFELVDTSDDSVLTTQTAPIVVTKDSTVTLPFNTLLPIIVKNTTIAIKVRSSSTQFQVVSWLSILASATKPVYITTTPTLSFLTPVNESSTGNVITISNYDADATYTFGTDVGTITYISGATATFDAKDVIDGDDDNGVITCYATKAGELRSDIASEPIVISFVPIEADDAYVDLLTVDDSTYNSNWEII